MSPAGCIRDDVPRYSDTTVYNKFRRRARCVRYLDAPTDRASCASPILRPSRIPGTYQRNYEICKQTRCNGGRVRRTCRAMFSQYPPAFAHRTPEIEVTSIRRRIPPHRKHPGELAGVCFLRKISRALLANLHQISLPAELLQKILPRG